MTDISIELNNPYKNKVKVTYKTKCVILDKSEIIDIMTHYSAEDLKRYIVEKIISQ